MIKKYKTSTLTKVFSLGLKQYGYKIDRGILTKLGLVSENIPIDSIDTISFGFNSVGQTFNYFYRITDKRGKEINLLYSTLEGNTYQDMFREIIKINPNIKVTYEMKKFLDSEISPKILRCDFNVHKGEFFKRNRELTQKYPSLDVIVSFTIAFSLLLIPLAWGALGNNLLMKSFGANYDSYRFWAIEISGISFTVALINIFLSLVSMYLGHKLTFILLIISLLGIFMAFKI